MSVRRPIWGVFIPTTVTAKLRTASFAAPTLLFGLASTAIVLKQSFYRNSLHDEEAATWDRIDRRAYIALPDGRTALVHPRIDSRLSLCSLWSSFKEMVNPLP